MCVLARARTCPDICLVDARSPEYTYMYTYTCVYTYSWRLFPGQVYPARKRRTRARARCKPPRDSFITAMILLHYILYTVYTEG